jgi:hypothetical protein
VVPLIIVLGAVAHDHLATPRSAPSIGYSITLDGTLPGQLVRDLIEDSYDLVVSALPKRVRERLGWVSETDLAAPLERPDVRRSH